MSMSSSTPPAAAVRRLPILETFRASYHAVFIEHIRSLPRASAVPFLLYIVVTGLSWVISYRTGAALSPVVGAPEEDLNSGLIALNFVLIPISLVPYVLFSVAWHRVLLLGPGAGRPSLLPSWSRRHWRSLGYLALVTLMVYGLALLLVLPLVVVWAIMTPGAASGEGTVALVSSVILGFLVLICVLFYCYARWSLVFPAVAVDETFGLKDSWRLTRGQGLRIVVAAVLVVLPFFLGLMVASQVILGIITVAASFLGTAGAVVIGAVLAIAYLAIACLSVALMISVITIAFRTVSGWVPPTQAIADAFR